MVWRSGAQIALGASSLVFRTEAVHFAVHFLTLNADVFHLALSIATARGRAFVG